AGAHKALAVGAEGHDAALAVVTMEGEYLGAGFRIPHMRHPPRAAGDAFAVGAEGHAAEPGACVPPESKGQPATLHVPHLHFTWIESIPVTGGQALAVRTEGHAGSRLHALLEGKELLALLGVPNQHRQIAAGAGDAFAVGADGHLPDAVPVPSERGGALA